VIPCHVHAEPVISLVLDGEGAEEVGGRTRPITAQDMLLTPAYAPHGYRFGHSGRWFNMQLADAWLARVADGAPRLPETAQIIHGHAAAAIGAPPSLEALAGIAGVHPTHLLRTFRRYHGATIANYARRRRVEYARAEIGRTRRSLSEIALYAGFADQAHLSRVLKRAFGVTPGVYARSLHVR
jgi:AraC-like DNA-binding protein